MDNQSKIRILIADDHAVVRDGLRSFLMVYDDLEMIGEAKNGEQAIRFCEQMNPDVVLMDLVMPIMDGATATKKIKELNPSIQIIALTSYKERDQVQSVLQAGAIGYLLKDITADELATAIRQAKAGKPTLAPEAVEVLIHSSQEPESKLGNDLTEREREVLKLMVDGLNNQQIAQKLYVSPSTAKSHVSGILAKLEVSTRTEAVSYALKNKLI